MNSKYQSPLKVKIIHFKVIQGQMEKNQFSFYMNVFVFYVLNGWYTIDGKALLFSSKISYFFFLQSVSLDTFSLLSVSLTVSIKSTVQNRNLHCFPKRLLKHNWS